MIDKIIEKLETERKRYYNIQTETAYSQGVTDGMEFGFKKSSDIVKQVAAEENNGWTKCSDEMPKETEKSDDVVDFETLAVIDTKTYQVSDLVLVSVIDHAEDTVFTMDDMTVDGKWTNFDTDDRYEVIAWQPLPKPYKEG